MTGTEIENPINHTALSFIYIYILPAQPSWSRYVMSDQLNSPRINFSNTPDSFPDSPHNSTHKHTHKLHSLLQALMFRSLDTKPVFTSTALPLVYSRMNTELLKGRLYFCALTSSLLFCISSAFHITIRAFCCLGHCDDFVCDVEHSWV